MTRLSGHPPGSFIRMAGLSGHPPGSFNKTAKLQALRGDRSTGWPDSLGIPPGSSLGRRGWQASRQGCPAISPGLRSRAGPAGARSAQAGPSPARRHPGIPDSKNDTTPAGSHKKNRPRNSGTSSLENQAFLPSQASLPATRRPLTPIASWATRRGFPPHAASCASGRAAASAGAACDPACARAGRWTCRGHPTRHRR